MIDEESLRRLDTDEKVRRKGRSAVLRGAAAHLRRSRRERIAGAYKRAYRGGKGLGEAFAGWEFESPWLEK